MVGRETASPLPSTSQRDLYLFRERADLRCYHLLTIRRVVLIFPIQLDTALLRQKVFSSSAVGSRQSHQHAKRGSNHDSAACMLDTTHKSAFLLVSRRYSPTERVVSSSAIAKTGLLHRQSHQKCVLANGTRGNVAECHQRVVVRVPLGVLSRLPTAYRR
ncbi:unnamed protein product [Protopolystoma xenopodis]|uniref:Uncharacterized protein n=1 Tax=Protopolystoma xenopodis TaxID=117903 RepID=A0A3S5BEL9_9PLAT|nr:unnamed protein product [Protopolystoma xenopodis]